MKISCKRTLVSRLLSRAKKNTSAKPNVTNMSARSMLQVVVKADV